VPWLAPKWLFLWGTVVGGVVFCGLILLEACLLRFGPLGASSLRFDPFGGVSFVVRSVGGVVFAVRSIGGRFHSKDEIEHQAVLARNTERTVLMVLK
jgi:hypothetical protein